MMKHYIVFDKPGPTPRRNSMDIVLQTDYVKRIANIF